MKPLTSQPVRKLWGAVKAPGDKSLSHRALMLAASAVGESTITGLLESDDVMRTAAALRHLGAEVEADGAGAWRVAGVGVGGFVEPAAALDMGNAGTGARLLMGLVASQPVTCFFTGDASLSARPMGRIAAPLAQLGARVVARSGCRLPLAVIGAEAPMPIRYRLPVASAQVKSAILLAALNTPGVTTVIEPEPTRDHTERMLRQFGAEVREGRDGDGSRTVGLVGEPELAGRAIAVAGDPSSAAFLAVAAAAAPEAEVTITGVCVNPLRTGLYDCLREMGADLAFANACERDGEPVADLVVRAAPLEGIAVPAARVAAMIDEFPVLAVAAACARGDTVMEGLGELRVKESDRLSAIARGLAACGVAVEEGADALTIRGCAGPPPGAARVVAGLDHRIAMAFLVLGAVAREPVAVDDGTTIATSFPAFAEVMNALGARIAAAG